jgi:hypothetical protein
MRVCKVLRFVLASWLAVVPSIQADGGSARDLIKALAPHGESEPYIVRGCSPSEEILRQEKIALELTNLGNTALPEIEQALMSIERRGQSSQFFPGLGWLLDAYVHIRRQGAFSRMVQIVNSRRLASLRVNIDYQVALSLDLTSYISDSRQLVSQPCRPLEPKDALNKLILAVENRDLGQIRASLGPDALDKLLSLVLESPSQTLEQELLSEHDPVKHARAMGYRFDFEGKWSKPEDLLRGADAGRDAVPGLAPDPELKTSFVDGHGSGCGTYEVDFQSVLQGPRSAYLVNNRDIDGLLRLIVACESR